MTKRLPSVAICRALRGKPLPGRDVLADLHTCAKCKRRYPASEMDYHRVLCRHCRHEIEAAMVEVMDEREDWCEERCRVEAWLFWRGL